MRHILENLKKLEKEIALPDGASASRRRTVWTVGRRWDLPSGSRRTWTASDLCPLSATAHCFCNHHKIKYKNGDAKNK